MISLHRTRLSFLPDLALDTGPSLISFLGPRNAVGAVKSSRLNIPQLPSSNVKSKRLTLHLQSTDSHSILSIVLALQLLSRSH